MGSVLLASGEAGAAVAEFAALVSREPADADLRNALGWSLLQAGRISESIASLREAVRLDPNSPRYRSNLNLALGRLAAAPDVARSL